MRIRNRDLSAAIGSILTFGIAANADGADSPDGNIEEVIVTSHRQSGAQYSY